MGIAGSFEASPPRPFFLSLWVADFRLASTLQTLWCAVGTADVSFSTGMPVVSGQPCRAIPEALANRSGPESAVFDEGSGSPA